MSNGEHKQNGDNKMKKFIFADESTMDFRVQALGLVAKHLGFEVNTMLSRGFSIPCPHNGFRNGDWVVTFKGQDAFFVDLVINKVSEAPNFNLFLKRLILK